MMPPIKMTSLEEFDLAFGELGTAVGPRTGRNKRSHDDKEWYVVRRFLKDAIAKGLFHAPLSINKGHPPDPDFVVDHKRGCALIEITEATDAADQREMTLSESHSRPILLGELGGRFHGGAVEPGHLWASDIVEAIERKTEKSVFLRSILDRHLVIYPNSNASFLISNDADERRAFSILLNVIEVEREKLSKIVNGCLVHVLGKGYTFFDVLDKASRCRRHN
jgi:hypothetical protein